MFRVAADHLKLYTVVANLNGHIYFFYLKFKLTLATMELYWKCAQLRFNQSLVGSIVAGNN